MPSCRARVPKQLQSAMPAAGESPSAIVVRISCCQSSGPGSLCSGPGSPHGNASRTKRAGSLRQDAASCAASVVRLRTQLDRVECLGKRAWWSGLDMRCWRTPTSTQQRLSRSHPGALALCLQHRNQRLNRLNGVGSGEFLNRGVALGTAARVAAYTPLKRTTATTLFPCRWFCQISHRRHNASRAVC